MSILTGYSKQQLQNLLNEAQTAYHQLLTGTKAVTVNRAGRSVTYYQASKSDLQQYIVELQNALGVNTQVNRRRVAGVMF